jgi:predicted tellurium resistance membrane protein TerC
VAVILAFIGGKMILDEVPGGFHVTTEQSLLFVAAALGVGVTTSLLFPEIPPVVPEKSENGALPAEEVRKETASQNQE